MSRVPGSNIDLREGWDTLELSRQIMELRISVIRTDDVFPTAYVRFLLVTIEYIVCTFRNIPKPV